MKYSIGDTIITVGTKIRSYDFPFNPDSYMEGVVIKQEHGLLTVKTTLVVFDSQVRDYGTNHAIFTTADVGESMQDELYPDWNRLDVLEKSE